MSDYLKTGHILKGNLGRYTVIKPIGRGGSTIAYLADFGGADGSLSRHIVKEFCPKKFKPVRHSDGSLTFDDSNPEFIITKENFILGGTTQNTLRGVDSLTNLVPPILDTFSVGNTVYLDVISFKGETYTLENTPSLSGRMRVCLSTAKIVKRFHDAGFLCLDIKPDNICVLDTTALSEDVVNYIDFDSITHKCDVAAGAIVSCTESWSAPEQRNSALWSAISEATDIFCLAEMVFWSVFERHSVNREHRTNWEYAFDEVPEKFQTHIRRPKLKALFTELFRGSLRTLTESRYQNLTPFIELLESIVVELEKKEYLCCALPKISNEFFGREIEMKQLEEALKENQIVFLSGVGGIGKSEIAKNYALKNAEGRQVLFMFYKSHFADTICDEKYISIANFEQTPDESKGNYMKRKLDKLKELLTKDDLIIIDNMDEGIDEILCSDTWSELMALPCKFIVTTRSTEVPYTIIEVGEISPVHLIELFRHHSGIKSGYDKEIGDIIVNADFHTLVIELIAKQFKYNKLQSLESLSDALFYTSPLDIGGKITVSDGDFLKKTTARNHIKAIFSLEGMPDDYRQTLMKYAFIPQGGIDLGFTMKFFKIEDMEAVNYLIDNGWLKYDYEIRLVSIHPLVSEAVLQFADKKICDELVGDLRDGYDEEMYLYHSYLINDRGYSPRKRYSDFSYLYHYKDMEDSLFGGIMKITNLSPPLFYWIDLISTHGGYINRYVVAYDDKLKEYFVEEI